MTRVVQRCPNCGVENDGPPREECEVCGTPLRFWCRVHSREIGWLSGAECPRCAAEGVEVRRPPPPPPPSTTSRPRRPRPTRPPAEEPRVVRPTRSPAEPPPAPRRTRVPVDAPPPPRAPTRRDPGEVLRDGAEEWVPVVATGARAVFGAIAVFIRTVLAWGVIGVLGGLAYAYTTGDDVLWSLSYGAMAALFVGVVIGAILALRVLLRAATSRRR